ncbi:MAG: hypothetical protein H7Y37_04895 [Anaerolineae bacterium]|nr:hypothetical protein [Gloeobacterales cyanobacterium ES-bin-313]
MTASTSTATITLDGLQSVLEFPLVQALFGRRSRRFSLGASIPDGPQAFTSRQKPLPLTELERMLVLTAAAGNSGWHHMITRHGRYAPNFSNYSAAAGGRTFPSAAGFHTSEVFFTDDSGLYLFETRDAPAQKAQDEHFDLEHLLALHRKRIRKLETGRLNIPPNEPHMEGHNTWCVNQPGSLLLIPVADIAQHLIAALCNIVENGYFLYDDVHREQIPGLERFRQLLGLERSYALSYMEQMCLTAGTAELSTCCYAGMLILQAIGLGGWMFNGIYPSTMLGASGDPAIPGLGFRYDTDSRWALPNPTGRAGVFEAFCPPHYPDMHAAVAAFIERKFGSGGPFHPDTPGPWLESRRMRLSAKRHCDAFIECVGLMAQYVYDRFGKFPGTVPSVLVTTYLQAHHLDLDFYDHYFQPGAYLDTHARHMALWHPD